MPIISHNGTFTIESPRGGHKTFRIKTAKHGTLEGKRILSLLNGPDNTADFIGFAFVADDESSFRVWNKYRGHGDWEMYATMLRDLLLPNSQLKAKGYRLLEATVCRVCNRKLTTPESVKSGLGPECGKRN